MCGLCPANRSDLSFMDFRPDAAFKTALCQPGNDDTRVSDHPIWGISGVSRFSYTPDEMHAMALGPVIWMHASVMHTLIHPDIGVIRGGAFKSRVERLWESVLEAYEACGTEKRLSTLTVGMLGKNVHPALTCKAAEARHLVLPMLHLLRKHHRGTSYDSHAIRCYELLDAIYTVFECAGMFLTTAEAQLVQESMDHFLLHYNWLANWSKERGEHLFHVTTKHHSLWHMAYMARFLNPTASHCYGFEDFIGIIKKCGHAQVIATPMHNVPKKIWQCYQVALADTLCVDITTCPGRRRSARTA